MSGLIFSENGLKTDLTFYKGSTINETIQYTDDTDTPFDITGYTAVLVARTEVGGEVILKFTTGTPAAGEGLITINGPEGKFILTMDYDDSLLIPLKNGIWELTPTDNDDNPIRPFLQGNFYVEETLV